LLNALLSRCPYLQYLNLSYSEIPALLLHTITQLPKLQNLVLYNSRMQKEEWVKQPPFSLFQLSQTITELDLTNFPFPVEHLEYLENLPLHSLHLGGEAITDRH